MPDAPKSTKGLSLSQDAWRKLKRNRVAMVSLWVLVSVSVLAFLTPMLPLQPPDRDQTSVQYQEPGVSPFWLHDFKLNTEVIAATPALVATLRTELVELEINYDRVVKQLNWLESGLSDTGVDESNQTWLEVNILQPWLDCIRAENGRARAAVRQKQAQIDDTIQAPYRKQGFAELGPLSRWMVRTRFGLFGDRSVNSLCGRDLLGRDLLSRLFWGARTSLLVGLVATIVSLVIGVTYGAVSGYCGGWVDDAMMRLVDVLYSVPFVFVVIFIITILGEESIEDQLAGWGINRVTVFFFVVGAIYWLTMARVVRGQVISLKTEQFVEAARSLGAGQRRVLFLHIVPNLFSVVIVYLTLTIPRVMLFEAFLSFLGLGVEPPDVSWGLLANEGIQVITPVKVYWWLVLFPSIALGMTLMALNFLGDGLRDALDPRMRTE